MTCPLDFTRDAVEKPAIETTTFPLNINPISHNVCCVTTVDSGKVACAYFASTEKFPMPAPTYKVLDGKPGKR